MNNEEVTTTTSPGRRSRAGRQRLKKHQEVDHVRVEDAWTFANSHRLQQGNHPSTTTTTTTTTAAATTTSTAATTTATTTATTISNPPTKKDTTTHQVGEAAYITATVQNRRYYGILVQGEVLQAANRLHWQQQTKTLELNRRMQAWQHARHKNDNPNDTHQTGNDTHHTVSKTENMDHDNTTTNITVQDVSIHSTTTTQQQQHALCEPPTKRPRVQNNALARDFTTTSTTDPQHSQTMITPTVTASTATTPTTTAAAAAPGTTHAGDKVEKYSYHAPDNVHTLLATYANLAAAAEDDDKINAEKLTSITKACQTGGGFVGKYYYQFQRSPVTLTVAEGTAAAVTASFPPGVWNTTLGLHSFLQSTPLPPWFPFSHYAPTTLLQQQQQHHQSLMLESLGIKTRDTRLPVALDQNHKAVTAAGRHLLLLSPNNNNNANNNSNHHLPPPMQQARSHYHVIILGAGIAGLSAALELFRQAERAGTLLQVTLVEGRDRVGGRLWTDRTTFHGTRTGTGTESEKYSPEDDDWDTAQPAFPVDLGAGWIHGIDMNPLAALAREAGCDFVTSSEEVTMLEAGHLAKIEASHDDRAGKLFDRLLDLAVEDCWKTNSTSTTNKQTKVKEEESEKMTAIRQAKTQAAVRWYGSILRPTNRNIANTDVPTTPVREQPAPHRVSDDISVDQAIGRVLRDRRPAHLSLLHDQERRMLLWNLKNVEYALGANVRDLSMRYWDIDERHAFDGDHVLLRQGYSRVVDYLVEQLQKRGDAFRLITNAPVRKVEYARKTATIPYFSTRTSSSMVELSDTCCVTTESKEHNEIFGDFLICALPLGVLKESLIEGSAEAIVFDPPLPFPKKDAIQAVGFGLLNKIYLQFPTAFWRFPGIVDDDTAQFGNASSCNPHHYMFFDMGKIMADETSNAVPPAILMTLVSGHEAVVCEQMDEPEVLGDVLTTLRTIFKDTDVPAPIAYHITKWGSDRFSRGSYTYLPPGCTEQDFHLLQAPINGNGDSTLLETAETYRVFFAGEHTTALHPSMAHGAMLSGYRAAKEVLSNMTHDVLVNPDADRTIPLSIFRYQFPGARLICSLCGVAGSTVREGSLLAFKRGPRAILVHNNCAEYSPEVEVIEGVWKHVFHACNRGKELSCFLCGKKGATIGCAGDRCNRAYHFSCAEDTGYRFDIDAEGKEFVCDIHRKVQLFDKQSRRVSLEYIVSTSYGVQSVVCALCGISESRQNGELLAFQQGRRKCLVHKNCAKYTSAIDLSEDSKSRIAQDYRNIFGAVDMYKDCSRCHRRGATIDCVDESCRNCYHFLCASGLNWNFEERPSFRCPSHRQRKPVVELKREEPTPGHDLFQHALFSQASGDVEDTPGNQDMGGPADEANAQYINEEDFFTDEESEGPTARNDCDPLNQPLSDMNDFVHESRFVGIQRETVLDHWNLNLSLCKNNARAIQYVSFANAYLSDDGEDIGKGEILVAVNGTRIGMPSLRTLSDILIIMKQEVELLVEVQGSLPSLQKIEPSDIYTKM